MPSLEDLKKLWLAAHDNSYLSSEDTKTVINNVYAFIWEQGAKAAALSLGHGGHNAENPYLSGDSE